MTSPFRNCGYGDNCFEKVVYLSKIGLKIGTAVSLYDVVLVSHTQGAIPTLSKVLLWSSRFAVPLASFAALSCAASNFRPPTHKKDYWNFTISGAISGAIFGVLTQSTKRALGVGTLGMICATFFNDALAFDYKIFGMEFVDGKHFYDRTLYINNRKSEESEENL